MAIDSRAKRQNVAQVGVPLPVSVLPSGFINLPARFQISWSYRGTSSPPPPGGVDGDEKLKLGYFGGIQVGGRN